MTPATPTRRERICGAVLAAAIGDALGHPTEFLSMDAIRRRFGPRGVTGFELYRSDPDGRRFAPFTDDTQMAELVLEALLETRELGDLDRTMVLMGEKFVEWARSPRGGHRAPGNACLAGCRELARGVSWREAGAADAGGCGSVMRAYPFGLVFADDRERAETWAVAHSRLTHGHPMALAACAAIAVGVAYVMASADVAGVTGAMEAAARRYDAKTAHEIAAAVAEARSGIGPERTLDRNRGWRADEAVAAAAYLFARHPDDPRRALLEGANTPGDSDSIATLAGALVGGRTGSPALPVEWTRDLERWEELQALADRV